MILCFWRRSQYSTYLEAKKMGGLREISGLQTEYRSLYEVGGDLADTLEAIHKTKDMMDSNERLGYVLLNDDGEMLDAC
jgi:hypothetical protein